MKGLRFYLDFDDPHRFLRVNLTTAPENEGLGYIEGTGRVFESAAIDCWSKYDRYYFLTEEDQEVVLEVIREYLIKKAKERGWL